MVSTVDAGSAKKENTGNAEESSPILLEWGH